PVSLAELKGKTVVLEWTNHGCPYVGKHYGTGTMQKLQTDATAAGVVWLTVISSSKGEHGYVAALEAQNSTRTATRRRHPYCSTRTESSATSTGRRPRRICSSSIRRGRSSTWAASTTSRRPLLRR